jgi:hypothetical protein
MTQSVPSIRCPNNVSPKDSNNYSRTLSQICCSPTPAVSCSYEYLLHLSLYLLNCCVRWQKGMTRREPNRAQCPLRRRQGPTRGVTLGAPPSRRHTTSSACRRRRVLRCRCCSRRTSPRPASSWCSPRRTRTRPCVQSRPCANRPRQDTSRPSPLRSSLGFGSTLGSAEA